jgi:hypothetical protein
MRANGPQLTALLIAPNRDLARQFMAAAEQARVFQVTSELKAYPAGQALEMHAAPSIPAWQ